MGPLLVLIRLPSSRTRRRTPLLLSASAWDYPRQEAEKKTKDYRYEVRYKKSSRLGKTDGVY
jgi:hypothetical protein